MKEQFVFELSNKFTELINEENKIELFVAELNANRNLVEDLLGSYHFASRGKVYDYSIIADSAHFKSDLTGQFKILYNVMYINGCQDLTYNEKDNKLIDFEIDLENRTVRLFGEKIPERMPDEF